ncbi:MAG: 3-phosphoshikimate 1-carboxyvinyltransferase, partial [Candidatus Ranarchaeia archaeon]
MDITVKSSELKGPVNIPPSKSYSHRTLIAGFMTQKRCIINNLLSSDDVEATCTGLEQLGASIIKKELTSIHTPNFTIPSIPIDCNLSGSTLRMLIGVCSTIKGTSELTGRSQLRKRPIGQLTTALKELGAKVDFSGEDGFAPLKVKGPRKSGKVIVDGSVSSQFISSLILSSPKLDGDTIIEITNPISKPYIDMTIDVMQSFGFKVKKEENVITVYGNQEGKSTNYIIPGSWSSAAYIAALGAVNGDLQLKNLKNDSQGDKEIIPILQKMGVKALEKNGVYEIKTMNLKPVTLDCGDTPDLVPAIAAIAAYANGTTTITNIAHLRYKESNRIDDLALQFTNLGVDIKKTEDSLTI